MRSLDDEKSVEKPERTSFEYAVCGQPWQILRANEDGTILSTDIAGGFVGATGPFCTPRVTFVQLRAPRAHPAILGDSR